MQSSRFTASNGKGFAFSLDALVAVTLIVIAVFLFSSLQQNTPISASQSSVIVEDTLFALENSGFLVQTIDSNTLQDSAGIISGKLLEVLPKGFDANVSVASYLIDLERCSSFQSFEECFPDANIDIGTAGSAIPAQAELVTGKKYFLLKQPQPDCNVSLPAEAAGPEYTPISWLPEKEKHGALFTDASFTEEDLNFTFDVTVSPTGSVSCDENVFITLTAETNGSFRKPIHIYIVMDRSRPPNELDQIDENVMITFLRNSLWDVDFGDKIGLASYDDTGHKDQALSSSIQGVESKIKNMSNNVAPANENAIAEGIQVANDLFDPTEPGNTADSGSAQFIVVLSDNADNSDTTTLVQQANRAVDLNVSVFTVGVGANANPGGELQNVADITGGEYYFAEDANALQALYNLIANRISQFASDSSIYVPTIDGALIVDDGGGELGDGNLVFDSGELTPGVPWTATYVLNFPCDSIFVCSLEALTLPGTGTLLTYTDQDGNSHSIDFNESITVSFKARDLKVDIISGTIKGQNDVELDVKVENVRELDAGSTTLKFYEGGITGTPLKDLNVSALCSQETPGCVLYSQEFFPVNLNTEGVIWAVINDENTIRECPIGNRDSINCYGAAGNRIFVVEYAVWRK